jgi:hypothetical protein
MAPSPALVGVLELLSAADLNILIFRTKLRIRILESRSYEVTVTGGGARLKQTQIRLARKIPQLAPPELDMVRAWLKPTYRVWFAHASLIWPNSSTSLDQKRVFQNFKNRVSSYYYIRVKFFK